MSMMIDRMIINLGLFEARKPLQKTEVAPASISRILGKVFRALFLGSLVAVVAHASPPRSFPPRPDYYVLDEAKVLDGRATHAIESLLTEHDRLTNEQVMVAIFKNANNTSPQRHAPSQAPNPEKEWSHRLFSEWKIGKRHYNEGILFTIFLDSGHAFLEVGYGLESKFLETQASEILDQTAIKHLRHRDAKAAAIWGAYRILEVLTSPLIQNGKALEILRQDGIPTQFAALNQSTDEFYEHTALKSGAWLALFFLGISLLSFVFYQILSREAHFTPKGWSLDYPWSRRNCFHKQRPHNQSTYNQSSPIVEAIRVAEESSSGQIRVHLSKKWMDKAPLCRARQLFRQYKIAETPFRNSVLIYVNLRQRKFAILGDTGMSQAVGPQYWRKIELELTDNLRSTQNERAIALTVASVGQALKTYFPSKRYAQ